MKIQICTMQIACLSKAMLFSLCFFSLFTQGYAQPSDSISVDFLFKYNDHYIKIDETPINSLDRIAQPLLNFEGKGYYLLGLNRAMTNDVKEQFALLGGEILKFLPRNSILLRCTREDFRNILELNFVEFAQVFQPEFVLSPALYDFAKELTSIGQDSILTPRRIDLSIRTFQGEDLAGIMDDIRELGGEIEGVYSRVEYHNIRILLPQRELINLIKIPGLSNVNSQVSYELYSDVAQGVMNINSVRNQLGLNGSNQKIAIADTGLDNGILGTSLHDDLEANTMLIISKPVVPATEIPDCDNSTEIVRVPDPSGSFDDGASDDNSGHGTHVASLAVGNGTQSAGQYAGVAQEASLIFQAIEQFTYYDDPSYNGYKLSGIPLDNLGSLFQEAYDQGARIHSNSWGASSGCNDGVYLNETSAVDEFAWNNQDMLILFSAGNSGYDLDEDNVVDIGSVGVFGIAKNVLTIGASENDRPTFTNTYRRFGLSAYGDNIANDRIANNPGGLAAFSSRGFPAYRIKPDAVAPGTFVVGARSQAAPNTIHFTENAETNSDPWIDFFRRIDDTLKLEKVVGAGRNNGSAWHDSPNGNYFDSSSYYFVLNPINISTGGVGDKWLRFWVRHDLAPGDICRIQVSDLALQNSTSSMIELVGTVSDWQQYNINLKSLSNATQLEVRIFMSINPDNQSGDGIYLDDLIIYEGAFGDGTLSEYGLTSPGSNVDQNYILYSGTSMSTPLVAGVAALVREYYTEIIGLNSVSAALMRATILNGTVDLSPGQYGIGTNQEISGQPDVGQGWGLVDAESILAPPLPIQLDYIDDITGLESNQVKEYNYLVEALAGPLSFTMVYHDYPGQDLVNHLDLKIIDPNGREFFPNGLNTRDEINNVERIIIPNPILGEYIIRVSASNVPQGPQPYAIAARGTGRIERQEQRQPVEIMLVLDLSGSMLNATCPAPDCPIKLDRLKEAVEIFLQLWDQVQVNGDKIGITYFRTNVNQLEILNDPLPPFDAQTLIDNLNGQNTQSSERTAMGGGLQSAINHLLNNGSNANKFVVLFTDGVQNMNPTVTRGNWSTRGSLLTIANSSVLPGSNIPPTNPVTEINTELGVTVNTIGVGTPAHVIDLLASVAENTNGIFFQTNVPDEELRRLFLEQLISILRGNTPQLIDYRYPEINSRGNAAENFFVNETASKLLFAVSWDNESDLELIIRKDGQDITEHVKQTQNGSFYQILTFESNHHIPNLGGAWEIVFAGENGTSFEIAAIVDEIEIDLQVRAESIQIAAGDKVGLTLETLVDGEPISLPLDINATVLRPRVDLGSLFARSQRRLKVPPSAIYLDEFSLFNRVDFSDLRSKVEMIEVENEDEGIFTSSFSQTRTAGVYNFSFEISGNHPAIGQFTRLEQISVNVGVNVLDTRKSDIRTRLLDSGRYQITITPKDRYGNLFGSGYAEALQFRLDQGAGLLAFADNDEGEYTLETSLPRGQKSEVAIHAFGEEVFAGPLRKLSFSRFYYFLQYGRLYIAENLNDLVAGGSTLGGGVGVNLGPHFSLEFHGRYLELDETNEDVSAAAELKWLMSSSGIRPYVKIGASYLLESSITGISSGLGFQFQITPRVQLLAGADYLLPIPRTDNSNILQLQAGLLGNF